MTTSDQPPRDPYTPYGGTSRSGGKREGLWILLVLLLVGGGLFWYLSGSDDEADTAVATETTPTGTNASTAGSTDGAADAPRPVESESAPTATADGRCIAGLSKSNVLEVLKQHNFRIDTLGSGRFRAIRKSFGADYEVSVMSDDGACVEDLNAWVKADGILKNAQATQDFFQLFADLPLKGAHPDSTFAWMTKSSTLPEATATYGGTRFTMAAPDRNTRVLRVVSSSEVAQK